jgi:hypothetical protein
MQSQRVFQALIVAVSSLIIAPAPAYAYIDPGAAGMLLQLVLGGLAGVLLVLKLYWKKIRSKLTRRRESARQ